MDTNFGESFDMGDQYQIFTSDELNPLMATQFQPNDYDASEIQTNSVWLDQPSGTNNSQIMSNDFSQLSNFPWDNTANEMQFSDFNHFSMDNAAWWADNPALQPTSLAPSYQLPFDAGNQIYGFNDILNPNLSAFDSENFGAESNPTFIDHEALQVPDGNQMAAVLDQAASPLPGPDAANHFPPLDNRTTAMANIGRSEENKFRLHNRQNSVMQPQVAAPQRCPWPICSQAFREEKTFTRHLEEHQYQLIQSWSSPTKCTWPKCPSGITFQKPSAWAIHLSNIHVKPLRCMAPGCTYPKPFGKKYDLDRHISTVHEKIQKYLCTFESCGKSFTRKDKLVKHEQETHACVVCSLKDCGDKLLVTEKESHIRKAHGPYECALDECQKAPHSSLLSRTKMRAHLRKFHKLERLEFREIFYPIWKSGDNWDETKLVVSCPASHCGHKMLHNQRCWRSHESFECRIGSCAKTASSNFNIYSLETHLRNEHTLTWAWAHAVSDLMRSSKEKSVDETTHPSCDPNTNDKLTDCDECLKVLGGRH